MNPRLPTLLISIGINALLLFLLLKGYNNPCPDAETITRRIDTVYVDIADVRPSVTVKVPEAYKIIKPVRLDSCLNCKPGDILGTAVYTPLRNSRVSPVSAKGLVLESVNAGGGGTSTGSFIPINQLAKQTGGCNDLVIYSDTTQQDNNYQAVIADTLQNNYIIGRRITFWNLKPTITEHIEKVIPMKERVRVYLGLSVGFEASYKQKRVSNFNIGPEVFITEPHGVMIGYGYDAKNNGHRLSFAYKIKLKK